MKEVVLVKVNLLIHALFFLFICLWEIYTRKSYSQCVWRC